MFIECLFSPVGSIDRRNTLIFNKKDGVFQMKQRTRIYYTPAQRSEMWDRWQRGESMSSIGRLFNRESSSVYNVLSPTGGIRPPPRKRSHLALTLSEREEISRGIALQLSIRAIAAQPKCITIDKQVYKTRGAEVSLKSGSNLSRRF